MGQVVRSARQLGTLIYNERINRNLSQQALAEMVGTGQKTISKIENGSEGTKLETLFRLLAMLGLEIELVPRSEGRRNMGDIF